MIETNRDTQEYTIYCDHHGCQEAIDIDTGGSWGDMLKELKEQGWRNRKGNDGVWYQTCAEHSLFRG